MPTTMNNILPWEATVCCSPWCSPAVPVSGLTVRNLLGHLSAPGCCRCWVDSSLALAEERCSCMAHSESDTASCLLSTLLPGWRRSSGRVFQCLAFCFESSAFSCLRSPEENCLPVVLCQSFRDLRAANSWTTSAWISLARILSSLCVSFIYNTVQIRRWRQMSVCSKSVTWQVPTPSLCFPCTGPPYPALVWSTAPVVTEWGWSPSHLPDTLDWVEQPEELLSQDRSRRALIKHFPLDASSGSKESPNSWGQGNGRERDNNGSICVFFKTATQKSPSGCSCVAEADSAIALAMLTHGGIITPPPSPFCFLWNYRS